MLRRAIVLRQTDADYAEIDRLAKQHGLAVVYTALTDTTVAKLAVMIAVRHASEHRAEVVVVPHLTAEDVWAAREWRALAELCDVVIGDGTLVDNDFAQP